MIYIFLGCLFLGLNFIFLLSFYGDYAVFITASEPWAYHGDYWNANDGGRYAGVFAFNRNTGPANFHNGSRLVDGYYNIWIFYIIIYLIILLYYRSLIPILL